jgi:hypothetical protein
MIRNTVCGIHQDAHVLSMDWKLSRHHSRLGISPGRRSNRRQHRPRSPRMNQKICMSEAISTIGPSVEDPRIRIHWDGFFRSCDPRGAEAKIRRLQKIRVEPTFGSVCAAGPNCLIRDSSGWQHASVLRSSRTAPKSWHFEIPPRSSRHHTTIHGAVVHVNDDYLCGTVMSNADDHKKNSFITVFVCAAIFL